MPAVEFELIERFFKPSRPRAGVVVDVGDDAAVVEIPSGRQLVITSDTLIDGVHFPAGTAPGDIGYKSLAVSLSDLAAMGAIPRWYTLALTLPSPDEAWLAGFVDGLRSLEASTGIALIGGDTTRGGSSITIQAMGLVRRGGEVLRSGAVVGDDIYVTGTLGDAALGLRLVQSGGAVDDTLQRCIERLNRPEPRTLAGYSLAPFVHAMIDCSDGFAADLGHVLTSSGHGAEIDLNGLPLSAPVRRVVEQEGWRLPLAGGDDYELIFTADVGQRDVINGIAETLSCSITRVGRVVADPGLRLLSDGGDIVNMADLKGYSHF